MITVSTLLALKLAIPYHHHPHGSKQASHYQGSPPPLGSQLEKCGRQVVVDDLNMDDRIEYASLFFRLHHEGYIHESVYPCNVLRQDGPLDRPMYQRGTGDFTEDGRKHTFRLIDFGRTRKYKNPLQRSYEEMVVEKTTKHTWYDDD